MFLTFYFKFTLEHFNASFTSKWQTTYFQEDPPPQKKKISNIKRKKGSFLSPEVSAYWADKQKCLTKNSRHDLLFMAISKRH